MGQVLLCCVLLTLTLASCAEETEEESTPSRTVTAAPVRVEDAVDRLELLGDVKGEVEVRVFSEMPERIARLHVEEGDRVDAGDPIATLDADLTAADVAQARAALAAAEASRDRLRSEVERIRGLVAQQAVATSQLEGLEANLRAAEAQVTQLEAARGAARERRSRTVVRAPIAGVVAGLDLEEGDMATPQMPLASVVQMDRVEVVIQVVEPDYVRLEEGMPVTVTLPSLEGVSREGTLVHLSPVLDRRTRTAQGKVRVANPDHVLRPGMVARTTFELGRRTGVVMAPAKSVLMTPRTDSEGIARVFVVEDGTARAREVTLGERYDEAIEIRDGLDGGESVVVEGQHLLRDGSAVRLAERRTGGAPTAEATTPRIDAVPEAVPLEGDEAAP